ncbi:MAG: hypothetical protein H6741_02400 [Alphaproteobacteria bacterium]|nr:hypothetical protein [Alphaproteobacteria bacterium]MCB9791555.1 hypothetical protein [Alphaproteobacteria bacterium]
MRRLHLRGASQADLRRATPLVEDALRVASIPLGPPGSQVVIRRLDLGNIDLGQPSQALAQRITERARLLMARAVHVLRPGAEQAPVVWFRGPWESQALLIRRLLRGPPPQEWFWRPAVPGWRPGQPPASFVRTLLRPEPFARPGEPPPALVAAQVVEALARWGLLVEALETLPAPPLLREALPDAPPARAPLPEPWGSAVQALVLRHGVDWPGLPWVLHQAATALWPERLGTLDLLTMASAQHTLLVFQDAAFIEVTEEPSSEMGVGERAPRPAELAAEARPVPPAPSPTEAPPAQRPSAPESPSAAPRLSPPPPEPPVATEAPPRPAAAPEAAEPWPPRPRAPRPPSAPEAPVASPDMASTGYGGVVAAIQLLERLGFQARVMRAPALLASAFGWRVLNATLDRLGADPADPLRAALAPRIEPIPLRARPFEPPASWSRLLGAEAPVLDFKLGEAAEQEAWVEALLALGERLTELPPEAWLRGEALLSADDTHLALLRPSSAVQLELRRAALDSDPGWVPWLGRVVTLRYLDDRRYAALKPTARG